MGFHLTGRTQDADGIAGAEVELTNFDTLAGTNGDSEASGERLKDLAWTPMTPDVGVRHRC